MKKRLLLSIALGFASGAVMAQHLKTKDVPTTIKSAFTTKYPAAVKVNWEKEKGNYEANWGGKSGEDNSASFTPAGAFIEIVNAIKISNLPANIAPYIKAQYNGAKIKEAGKVTDAAGKTFYEAEIKAGDLIFDETGKFVKKD